MRGEFFNMLNAANLVRSEMGILEQEHLRVMLLDTRNNVLKTVTVYSGSLNAAVVRVGEVCRECGQDQRYCSQPPVWRSITTQRWH